MKDPKNIEDYEAMLGEAIAGWTHQQRVMLAASHAERWLPVYRKFSKREKWGDPANLGAILDAVWGHACGKPLQPADIKRHKGQLDDSTPHMDDFDAPSALAACVILSDALECCKSEDNAVAAVRSALSGFEAAVPDLIYDEEADITRLWKKTAAKRELKKQLKTLEMVAALAKSDDAAIEKLRAALAGKDLAGEAAEPEEKVVPAGAPNKEIFDYYRKRIENALRSPVYEDKTGSIYAFGMRYYSQWAMRYVTRRRALTGRDFPVMADIFARDALVARNMALDAKETDLPDWKGDLKDVILICFRNPMSEVDAKGPEAPHGYGPSLRALWSAAKRAGKDDQAAWDSIMEWARHKSPAWEEDDKRRKKGLAHEKALGGKLSQQVAWQASGDPLYPWGASVDGVAWKIRLNDFPDALMYTLLENDTETGSFHDWPAGWTR